MIREAELTYIKKRVHDEHGTYSTIAGEHF